jgi:hypothetical protein
LTTFLPELEVTVFEEVACFFDLMTAAHACEPASRATSVNTVARIVLNPKNLKQHLGTKIALYTRSPFAPNAYRRTGHHLSYDAPFPA